MLTAVAVKTNKSDIFFLFTILSQIRFNRERERERERERDTETEREADREHATFSKGTNTSRD